MSQEVLQAKGKIYDLAQEVRGLRIEADDKVVSIRQKVSGLLPVTQLKLKEAQIDLQRLIAVQGAIIEKNEYIKKIKADYNIKDE